MSDTSNYFFILSADGEVVNFTVGIPPVMGEGETAVAFEDAPEGLSIGCTCHGDGTFDPPPEEGE